MLSPEESKKRATIVRLELNVLMDYPPDTPVTVTCEQCQHNDNCEWAWDHYNTDGDCLALK